jgi:hypothetical protein
MQYLEPTAKPSAGFNWHGYPSGETSQIGEKLSKGVREPTKPTEGGESAGSEKFNVLDLYYPSQPGGEAHLHVYLELIGARELYTRIIIGKTELFAEFNKNGWQVSNKLNLPPGEIQVQVQFLGGSLAGRLLACYFVLGPEAAPPEPGKEGKSGWHSAEKRDVRIRTRVAHKPPGFKEVTKSFWQVAAATVFILTLLVVGWIALNMAILDALRRAK